MPNTPKHNIPMLDPESKYSLVSDFNAAMTAIDDAIGSDHETAIAAYKRADAAYSLAYNNALDIPTVGSMMRYNSPKPNPAPVNGSSGVLTLNGIAVLDVELIPGLMITHTTYKAQFRALSGDVVFEAGYLPIAKLPALPTDSSGNTEFIIGGTGLVVIKDNSGNVKDVQSINVSAKAVAGEYWLTASGIFTVPANGSITFYIDATKYGVTFIKNDPSTPVTTSAETDA